MKRLLILIVISLSTSAIIAQNSYDDYLNSAYTLLKEGDIEKAKQAYGVYTRMTNKTDKELESILFNNNIEHEYVDLGLSVLWATCNIGATKPEEYGDYYAWGETSTKSSYTWENYRFRTSGDLYKNVRFNKYNTIGDYGTVDNKNKLDDSDDVAHVKWGGKWRMPTKDDFTELLNNCTWALITLNGVKGYKVTSNKSGYTDRSIFLPAAGARGETRLYYAGSDGLYWSSSLNASSPYNAWTLNFFNSTVLSDNLSTSDEYRGFGRSIRPVYCPSEEHEYVDLGLSVKWATCNIGATSPEEYGDYYAWGETYSRKNEYTWKTYKYCDGTWSKLTKYCNDIEYGNFGYTDNRTTLELSDDVARDKWSGSWRMPTEKEFQELIDNCTWTWTSVNNVNGYKVTSRKSGYTSSSIFLPAARFRSGTSLNYAESYGDYWSCSLNTSSPDRAYGLHFGSDDVGRYYYDRDNGLSVRAVCP